MIVISLWLGGFEMKLSVGKGGFYGVWESWFCIWEFRLSWQWGMTGEASSRGCAAGGGLGPRVVLGE